MKRALLLLFLTVASFALNAQSNPVDAVRKSFIDATLTNYAPTDEIEEQFLNLSDRGRANDLVVFQLYCYGLIPESEVDRLISLFDFKNGSWKDIDYQDLSNGSWHPSLHMLRLNVLSKAYCNENHKYHKDAKVSELIHKAIKFWGKNMFVCPNWWHNQIGNPKKFAPVLVLMKDELSPEELEIGLKILEPAKFGLTGQNKVWLSGINLVKGIVLEDAEMITKARDLIAEEIKVSTQEGIQPDWSFHQHGPQMQFGNYGLAFNDAMAFWLRVLSGTEFSFTPEQVEVIENYVSNGLSYCFWKGIMDVSACGRQPFRNGPRAKGTAFSVAAQHYAEAADIKDKARFESIKNENMQPEKYPNTLVGAKYFPRSEYGVYRTKDWFSSVRMHSMRTIGYEYTNHENTLAHFSADGTLILMQDGYEYDDIVAFWDWRKLPGVTAYDNGTPLPQINTAEAKENHSYHVNGIAHNDMMATTIQINRDSLRAMKAAFFFKDMVVALGAGIGTSHTGVTEFTTALDQSHLKGDIKSGSNWVHHNNRGYITLDNAKINVSDKMQSGDWYKIDHIYKDNIDSGRVFKLWVDHDVTRSDNSYAYALLPCTDAAKTAKLAKSGAKVKILSNTEKIQAVKHNRVTYIVFHEPGALRVGLRKIKVSEPMMVIKRGCKIYTEPFQETIPQLADRVMKVAEQQFIQMDSNVDEGMQPRSYTDSTKLEQFGITDWCSGFYPGSLWYIYEYTKNEQVRQLADKYTKILAPLTNKEAGTHHDIGFQINSSFGNGLRITGDEKSYKETLIKAADKLAARFNPKVGCIRSWDWHPKEQVWEYPVIIDNMMNLELLMNASIVTGKDSYAKVASSHANTTMKNHFRPDYTTFHLVEYSPKSGNVKYRRTYQGLADTSTWARGEAWALYGYTMMYEKSIEFANLNPAAKREPSLPGNEAYLLQAMKIADWLLVNMPDDGVPYWDFNDPDIPNAYRDASAAAVMASAFARLGRLAVNPEVSFCYTMMAEKIVRELASERYLAEVGDNGNFILKHSVGHKPEGREVDTPLIYADYYFLEAIHEIMKRQ